MKKIALEQQVTEYISYWKKQLRLDNWQITSKAYYDHKELDCFARNKQNPNYESAVIEYLHPNFIPEDWVGTRDIEVTIVHEILHTRLIYVSSLSNKKKKKWPIEMAIETIAKSLVANRRGVDPEELK